MTGKSAELRLNIHKQINYSRRPPRRLCFKLNNLTMFTRKPSVFTKKTSKVLNNCCCSEQSTKASVVSRWRGKWISA